ncbi:MAG: hypothetical protein ABFD89_24910 [Bryobacteraceae bacterium]
MEIPNVYHIVVCICHVVHLDHDTIKAQPGLALYHVDGADLEHQIDMALLDHLHSWSTTIFVGGDVAKREAAAYHAAWIADVPSVNDDLFRFWRDTAPVPDCP